MPTRALLHPWSAGLLVSGVVCLAFALPALAADEESPSPIDSSPYDLVYLIEAVEPMRVAPLDLPNRQTPNPRPDTPLLVQWTERPGEVLEVDWASIDRIEFYEQLLLKEAERLTAAGRFDDAFRYFSRLKRSYPNIPGLRQAIELYMQRDALAAFQKGEHEQALATLMSLHQQNREFPGLDRAIEAVTDRMIAVKLADRQPAAARQVLDVASVQFKELRIASLKKWEEKFDQASQEKLTQGRRLLAANSFAPARAAAEQALQLDPKSLAAKALLEEIQRARPSMLVGVLDRPALERLAKGEGVSEGPAAAWAPRLDLPATSRAQRLTFESLSTLVGYTSEGGEYRFLAGDAELDTAGESLTLRVSPARLEEGFRTDAVARALLVAADPLSLGFEPSLRGLVGRVECPSPQRVIVELLRLHVSPLALLTRLPQGPPRRAWQVADPNRWSLGLAAEDGTTLTLEEVFFADEESAVTALRRGEVDVLANVPLWRLDELRSTEGVRVGQYRLPSVHMLVPCSDHPLVQQREFRRALAYGIACDAILRSVLLGDREEIGCQVVSGPFPNGLLLEDSGVGYGYNDRVAPRPYLPRLAGVLASLAWRNVLVAQGKDPDKDPSPKPTLRLAYPAEPIAQTACESIKLQLAAVEVPIELIPVTEAQIASGQFDADLRYVQAAMWEPLADARRLLGPQGIAGGCSDAMLIELDSLDRASSWEEVSDSLQAIHQLAYGELPVIPLWQLTSFYAYRTGVEGIEDRALHLYDVAPRWRKQAGATP